VIKVSILTEGVVCTAWTSGLRLLRGLHYPAKGHVQTKTKNLSMTGPAWSVLRQPLCRSRPDGVACKVENWPSFKAAIRVLSTTS
ncbi:uncharacterized protein METZ01_LOCUS176584, partial [marine metagenome]